MTAFSIRPATAADCDALVALGRAMRAESPVRFPEIEPAAVAAWLALAVENPANFHVALALSGDRAAGLVNGAVGPYAFSAEPRACCDTLFVMPEYRGRTVGVRLMRAFLDWAASAGAVSIYAGVSAGIAPDRTGRLFEHLGFAPLGRTYRREIQPCVQAQTWR